VNRATRAASLIARASRVLGPVAGAASGRKASATSGRKASATSGRKAGMMRTAQYVPPPAAGTNSAGAISPGACHRKVIVLQNLQYREKVGLYSREQKGYAGSVRKTASEAVARCVLLPFPMRLAHFGRRIPASVQSTPLRPASNQVPQPSGPN